MAKSHAIVHSIPEPSTSPIQATQEITTPPVSWYTNPSTWVNVMVVAASASAIGATVAVATYQSSPIETHDLTNSTNETVYMARLLNVTAAAVILHFALLNCSISDDDAILAREHFVCGQSRASVFSIVYPNMISIENNQIYDTKQIESKPNISFNYDELTRIPSNEKNQTYIVLMLDIDDPINSPIQHWILTIDEKTTNQDICSYKTPNEYFSSHRYTFLLYTTSLKNLRISDDSCIQSNKFPLNKIINDNQLKLLASICFILKENLIPSFIDEK